MNKCRKNRFKKLKLKNRKEKKKIGMQIQIEVNEEDLYTLKINCKGKITIGNANKGINVENI